MGIFINFTADVLMTDAKAAAVYIEFNGANPGIQLLNNGASVPVSLIAGIGIVAGPD